LCQSVAVAIGPVSVGAVRDQSVPDGADRNRGEIARNAVTEHLKKSYFVDTCSAKTLRIPEKTT